MLQSRREVAEEWGPHSCQEPLVAQCTSTSWFSAFHSVQQQQSLALPPTILRRWHGNSVTAGLVPTSQAVRGSLRGRMSCCCRGTGCWLRGEDPLLSDPPLGRFTISVMSASTCSCCFMKAMSRVFKLLTSCSKGWMGVHISACKTIGNNVCRLITDPAAQGAAQRAPNTACVACSK